jgi:hypothetical protein
VLGETRPYKAISHKPWYVKSSVSSAMWHCIVWKMPDDVSMEYAASISGKMEKAHSSESQQISTKLRGFISQKTVISVFTTVRSYSIVTCKVVVRVTKIIGSTSDDWIYYHLGYKFSQSHLNTALSLLCEVSRHLCTHTRIVRLY